MAKSFFISLSCFLMFKAYSFFKPIMIDLNISIFAKNLCFCRGRQRFARRRRRIYFFSCKCLRSQARYRSSVDSFKCQLCSCLNFKAFCSLPSLLNLRHSWKHGLYVSPRRILGDMLLCCRA